MDVITFGESMVVFSPDSTGPLRFVNTFTKSLGGAETNVALALVRLGHEVGWFSKVGNDEFGRYVVNTVRAEGVDVSRTIIDRENKTGILFKEREQYSDPNIYYYRKNSAASSMSPDDIDADYIKSAKILHITGITPALSESAASTVFKAVSIAKENGVLVSFDPNVRLKLWSLGEAKKVLLQLADMSDIIMPGLDEVKILTGIDTPEEAADYFRSRGAGFVAVKLGKEGCYLKNKKESMFVPGFKVENIVDTVGAGDGFAAGLISGILRNLNLKACGEYANGVGAMATLVKGDMEGYPYYDQLLEFIGKKKHVER